MNVVSPDLKTLRQWLLDANYTLILEIAEKKKGILSQFTALTYNEDATISDRAIEATGFAARIITNRDPEYVRNYLLRLFWLLNDESGGVGWHAPELIGEILYQCPQFSQFFPMLVSLLDLEAEDAPRFCAGTLWAIGRVAQVERESMLPALPCVQALIFSDKLADEGVKEKAIWCMGQLLGMNP